ncbi:MAG TPA: wax ester/triacylglycerol synthase family O-acyltransferase [Micromonosporaceae bacterium]|jgi:WS/DGAT/MGAT family acyltransferase
MERLTAQDLIMLWPDDVGWPQDIGAFAILDPGDLLDSDGRLRVEAVRRAIEARLHLVPRFRQRLHRPCRGLGGPFWADAPDFDIADHVRVTEVPAPGDEAQLLLTIEGLRRRPLDRSQPLWQMWFLAGLPDGRVGFYMKVHHAIADGAAGVATLGALLDAAPNPHTAPGSPFAPAPVPSIRELFADNVRRRARELVRAASVLLRPVRTVRGVRAGWPAVHETLATERAPRTSLNRPIGPGRQFAVIRGSIDQVKQVAHRYGATVNDALVAAIAGGLRDLLRGRGERVDDVVLRAYAPVSLHRERPGLARGNKDGVMAISLPLGVPDPIARLRLIAAETAERKKRTRPPAGTLLRNRVAQRVFLRLMARQRWANVYVANVPGPPVPLYLAGARLLELFPMVPLTGNLTLGVGALSYAGQFNITAVADRDACPDVEIFAEGVRDALRSMAAAELVPS